MRKWWNRNREGIEVALCMILVGTLLGFATLVLGEYNGGCRCGNPPAHLPRHEPQQIQLP